MGTRQFKGVNATIKNAAARVPHYKTKMFRYANDADKFGICSNA